ncbi:MAG: serine/threonine kinase family protein [Deltaproteobacteria bacterium]|nr:serine/threonine kinase family protein [Deltaproteobacteria bacterium]
MACPPPQEFSEFVSGSLAPDARDALEAHVDTCTSCRITLSELGRTGAAAAASRPALPVLGERVERYEIVGELGAGAMGIVYRARDPELDRELAVKLVQPQAGVAEDELVRQRMLREGRALARIDHPNVVRVFDVGWWRGALFVAMERAPGVSLRLWLAAQPRSARAIVDVFVQCALGLAAAHDAGVIHRDFKPDNVVVDEAGRARVMDFGLAQTAPSGREVPHDPDPLDRLAATAIASEPGDPRLTRTRGIVGTPAYMAPEQHRGTSIDGRADQFAWCVALAEALGGHRPYRGDTVEGMLAAMASGRPELPATIARPVRRVLARGLAFAPDRRFPSMTAVVRAIAPPHHGWPALAVGLATVAVTSVLVVGLRTVPDDPCAGVAAPVAATWNPSRAARIGALFASIGRPFAERTWQYAQAGVERYAGTWTASRVGVCRAGVERGELDAAARAATVRCLERRVIDLEAILARWEHGELDVLATAPHAVDTLVPTARCMTPELDAAPATESDRLRLQALVGRFAAARVASDTGHPLDAEPVLAGLDRELAATPFHALRAELLIELSSVERDLGKRELAREQLVTALAEAETARADRARAAAWIAMAALTADDFVRGSEARDALRLASAVLDHLGNPEDLARLHDATRGLVALRTGDPAEAVAALRRSLDVQPPLPATERASRTQMLARALIAAGQVDTALAELGGAEALLVSALGPDAPQLVFVLNSMMEPLEYLGHADQAIARGERALALFDASYGKLNPRRIQLLGNLAGMYASAGDRGRARALEEDAVHASERQLGPDAVATANARLNLAITLVKLGEPLPAIGQLDRALVIYTKVLGAEAPVLANVHSTFIGAYGALHQPAEALAHAQRALAIREVSNVPAPYVAYSRLELADALVAAGQRDQGIAMARRALEIPLDKTGREAELAAEIRRWLAAQTRPR